MAFVRFGTGAVAAVLGLGGALCAQTTTRVSEGASNAQGNGPSSPGVIAPDGRSVVFTSAASNLVPPDVNGVLDAFTRVLASETTTLVSVTAGGTQGNAASYAAAVSADGRFEVFSSSATNLLPGMTHPISNVYVRERSTGVLGRVSVDSGGTPADGNSYAGGTSISADGRYVAFDSYAFNLADEDWNELPDVFVHDRQMGVTTLVSTTPGGAVGNGLSGGASISADGRYVAFASEANDLVAGDTGSMDVFVRDLVLGTTERVTLGLGGQESGGFYPSISPDGRFVAFISYASNLVPGDTGTLADTFVHDLQLGTTTRVSVGPGGVQGNDQTAFYMPVVSAGGRFVAFGSAASNLVGGDTNGRIDVFVRDMLTETTTRVSTSTSGLEGNGDSYYPSISSDGRHVAFQSLATNLTPGDTNAAFDVFVHDRGASSLAVPFCAGDGVGALPTTACPCANFGAPGHGCASSVVPAGATLAIAGEEPEEMVLAGSGMPATVSCIYLQGDLLADAVFGDGVRCAGGTMFRLRARQNVGGASTFPDATDTITLAERGGVTPGSGAVRYYQTYYRNAAAAFCPPETFNVTNGLELVW